MVSNNEPSTATKSRRKKKLTKWQKFRKVIKICAALFSIGFIFVFFAVLYYANDLPDIDKLNEDKDKPSITILDANGDFLASYGDIYTEYVKYNDVPKSLIDAVIATEDRRFFEHFGIDIRGLGRAIVVNIVKGRLTQGGSTITQQLAKNVFLTPKRNIKRKIQEAVLAIWIERRYNKKQIMEMYLNRVYLGSGVYGIDGAARKYFKKSARKLNLYESAMIAGMLKAPTAYSPQNNAKAAAKRTEQVLLNMIDANKISEKEMKKAYRQANQLEFERPRDSDKYFTDYVVEVVPELVGSAPQKLIVRTTLIPQLQKFAEGAVSKNILEYGDANKISQSALIAMSPSGAVRAMIGGENYSVSQFNRAVHAKRQPGSLFKLFVYLSAFENGFGLDTIVQDSPITVDNWRPRNFDGTYNGEVTVKDAFTRSLNVATVYIAEIVGRGNVLETAKRMGIHSALAPTPSVVLGASEVTLDEITAAYATVANNGFLAKSFVITEIKTPKGNILYEYEPAKILVISEDVRLMINSLLKSVVEYGTGRSANIGRPVAGKTGTSQDYKDAWFVGFVPNLVTGVWVGNDNNTPMKKVTGGFVPAKIWRDFMMSAMEGTNPMPIPSVETENNESIIGDFWDQIIGQ